MAGASRRLRGVALALLPHQSRTTAACTGAQSPEAPSLPTEATPPWAFETWEDDVPPPPPAGWSSRYVMANGIRLHYWRTPGGRRLDGHTKPIIVLAHGYADCGLSWWYAMHELTDLFELIALDARGHGLSDPPAPTTPADAQAEDIAAVIRELGLVKPIVMGHSMGAAATMWFAARHPDVPRAVVLEDPALSLAGCASVHVLLLCPTIPTHCFHSACRPNSEPAPEPTEQQVAKAEAELQGSINEILTKNNMSEWPWLPTM